MEEFGARAQVGDPFACFTYTNEVKGSHSIEVIYFATFVNPIKKIRIEPEDHSGFIWIAADEVAKASPMTEVEERNVRKAFQLLSGGSMDIGLKH